jgi:hypothetical protein
MKVMGVVLLMLNCSCSAIKSIFVPKPPDPVPIIVSRSDCWQGKKEEQKVEKPQLGLDWRLVAKDYHDRAKLLVRKWNNLLGCLKGEKDGTT